MDSFMIFLYIILGIIGIALLILTFQFFVLYIKKNKLEPNHEPESKKEAGRTWWEKCGCKDCENRGL